MHLVVVAAPITALAQIAGQLEVADDLGCGPLGDPNRRGDVAEARGRVDGDDLEHVSVVRHEPKRMILLAGA